MSENVTKTKEQDGRKPGEDYRDADGVSATVKTTNFAIAL